MCNKYPNRPLEPFPRRTLYQHCGEHLFHLRFRSSHPQVCCIMDGLSGSLTVGFWGDLANGRQWQGIRGWELREDRIFVPFYLTSSPVVACLPISFQLPLPNMSLGRPTTLSARSSWWSENLHSVPASLSFPPPAIATCFASFWIASSCLYF